MKNYLIILHFIIFSISYGQNKSVTEIDKTKIAVLPYKLQYDFIFKDCKNAKLNNDEFIKLEVILNKCIDEHNIEKEKEFNKIASEHPNDKPQKDDFIINLERYKRQYIVVLNSQNEKEVWINCFCYTDKKWKKELIGTNDGGNCYFKLKINLNRKEYYDFYVNGDA